MARDAYTPRVFRKPTGILESLIYHASVRIPQPDLPGAMGTPTPMNIRVSTGNAGVLMMTRDSNGNPVWSVAMRERMVEQ